MMRSSGQNCNAEMKRRSRDELRATPAPGALTPPRAPLIPKLRGQVAEFLHERSLERLRILIAPTCVGFSTGGLLRPPQGFSCLSFQELWDRKCPRACATATSNRPLPFPPASPGLSTGPAQDSSTSKLLRTFETVAASKPTSWLSQESNFLSH